MRKDYPLGPHDKHKRACALLLVLRVTQNETSCNCSVRFCLLCLWVNICLTFLWSTKICWICAFFSETLVTGKLYEDILESAHEMADPERFDAVVFTNLCVPSASGVPLRLLPKEINGVRIIGIDVPGFGIPRMRRQKMYWLVHC